MFYALILGFRIALLATGFFLLLIAPTSSDPHHRVKLSHMEIWRQTMGDKTRVIPFSFIIIFEHVIFKEMIQSPVYFRSSEL